MLVAPERVFERQVIRVAELTGWSVWKDRATNLARTCANCGQLIKGKRNQKGWPDLFLIRPPRLVVAELKSATGRVSRDQRAWLDLFGRIPGLETYVWRPADWPEIVQTLSR